MHKQAANRKGVVLFLVLATIVIVVFLANIILGIVSTQSRFSHHQVSRVQAIYAAKAAMNVAIENLRTGGWVPGVNCTVASGGCNYGDPAFSPSIRSITIFINAAGTGTCNPSPLNTSCIGIVTNYTALP